MLIIAESLNAWRGWGNRFEPTQYPYRTAMPLGQGVWLGVAASQLPLHHNMRVWLTTDKASCHVNTPVEQSGVKAFVSEATAYGSGIDSLKVNVVVGDERQVVTLKCPYLSLKEKPGPTPYMVRVITLLSEDGQPVEFEVSKYSTTYDSVKAEWWIKGAFSEGQAIPTPKDKTAKWKGILAELEKLHPFEFQLYWFLHSKKTQDGFNHNQALLALQKDLEAKGAGWSASLIADELAKVLTTAFAARAFNGRRYYNRIPGRDIACKLPHAQELERSKKAKRLWHAAQGLLSQAELLGIKKESCPNLVSALESGKIPLSIFHEVGKQDNLVNVEFGLWERALSRPEWRETLYQVAAAAASRKKFSKRVTSYLAFLFEIEEYLNKHAPRPNKSKKKRPSWKAMPKAVSSEWELEMDEATEEGTTKKRSAMTPVVDNETGIITVPYVTMRLYGAQTSWCYSEKYFVAREGREDLVFAPGGCFESDLAEKLNGRDDYGLCYYTLTGSDQNKGYPTFLIIFERTTLHGTRVHFHRVHPSRSRGPNGTPTPPSALIQECYRYMAGNVKAEEISYQQGDILLTKTASPGAKTQDPVDVFGFENHTFEALEKDGVKKAVRLFRSTAKKPGNVLGWLYAETGMRMPHPEHEPVEDIEPGWYTFMRCKSWEANPTAVWSLNID